MRTRLISAIAVGLCIVLGIAGALVAQQTWMIGPFNRPAGGNPVIKPMPESVFQCPVRKAPVHWEALHTFNPAAIVKDGKVYVLYRAEDDSGEMAIGGHTSRIGLAESTDGIHFKRRPEPVLYPAEDDQKAREWPGGCEDPRIVEAPDGTYVMTYTQWNRKTYDAGIATSADLVHWVKHGPMLAKAAGGKYQELQYKSAAIVTELRGGRLLAAKIDGSYWMFWGEGNVHLARSQNLIDWTPVETAGGELVNVLSPREGKFDSSFPEAGPPPILADRGIVVLYNGKNSSDPNLERGAYAVGQARFRAYDPQHMIDQLDKPFFQPEMPFEKSGQYAAGTTFAEGLVRFHNHWILYYGCADSLVGVAITP